MSGEITGYQFTKGSAFTPSKIRYKDENSIERLFEFDEDRYNYICTES